MCLFEGLAILRFHGPQTLNNMSISACYWESLFLMLSYYLLRLGLQSGFLPPGCPNNMSVTLFLPPRKRNYNKSKLKLILFIYLFMYWLNSLMARYEENTNRRQQAYQMKARTKPQTDREQCITIQLSLVSKLSQIGRKWLIVLRMNVRITRCGYLIILEVIQFNTK